MTFECLSQEWTESEKNDQNDVLTWWKKTSWDKKFKKEMNITRLIESKKIMWHIKHVKHKKSKSQECTILVSSMSSMTHVKHVKHDTLKMYSEVYKHIFYSAEKNLFTFLLLHFF